MKAIRPWSDIFKVLKTKTNPLPIYSSVSNKNILQKRQQNKDITDTQKLREFVSSSHAL